MDFQFAIMCFVIMVYLFVHSCRAETLLGGLGGEKSRWCQIANQLNDSLVNVVGDVLIAAGFVTYLGYFNVKVSHLHFV